MRNFKVGVIADNLNPTMGTGKEKDAKCEKMWILLMCALFLGDRLLDIPCKVCGDRSSGKHYGIYSCDGCSGFFKRSIHRSRVYTCKAQGEFKGRCPIDKTHRNQCRACRLKKCFDSAMNKDGKEFKSKPQLQHGFHLLYKMGPLHLISIEYLYLNFDALSTIFQTCIATNNKSILNR